MVLDYFLNFYFILFFDFFLHPFFLFFVDCCHSFLSCKTLGCSVDQPITNADHIHVIEVVCAHQEKEIVDLKQTKMEVSQKYQTKICGLNGKAYQYHHEFTKQNWGIKWKAKYSCATKCHYQPWEKRIRSNNWWNSKYVQKKKGTNHLVLADNQLWLDKKFEHCKQQSLICHCLKSAEQNNVVRLS